MSARSELLFQARMRISNPFLLCTLISGRTRQLMMSANRNSSTVELVDHALNELLAGVLEFGMHPQEELESKAPPLYSHLIAAWKEALEERHVDSPD